MEDNNMNIFIKSIYSLILILIIHYNANSSDQQEAKQNKSTSLVVRYEAIVANLKDNPNKISYNSQVLAEAKQEFKRLGIDTVNVKKYGYENVIMSSYLRPGNLKQEVIEQIALAQAQASSEN